MEIKVEWIQILIPVGINLIFLGIIVGSLKAQIEHLKERNDKLESSVAEDQREHGIWRAGLQEQFVSSRQFERFVAAVTERQAGMETDIKKLIEMVAKLGR